MLTHAPAVMGPKPNARKEGATAIQSPSQSAMTEFQNQQLVALEKRRRTDEGRRREGASPRGRGVGSVTTAPLLWQF